MAFRRLRAARQALERLLRDPLGFELPITLDLRESELPGLERPLAASA